jgi:RNA polymerase sigma factor (sigma-70 family)
MRAANIRSHRAPVANRPRSTPVSSGWSVPVLENASFNGTRPGAGATSCEVLLDDAALISRVQNGDEAAAVQLVERLRPTVLKCIRRRLPRWASEEDLVQVVFSKVFSHLHQFSGSVPLEHWVSRIAVNTSLNHINYEAVRPEMRMSDLTEEQEAMLVNQSEAATEATDCGYAREALDLLMAHLTPDERRLIVLLHIEQRSTREISQMTGLSVSLVKVKAFRTRHKMQKLGRRLLRENGHEPAFLAAR